MRISRLFFLAAVLFLIVVSIAYSQTPLKPRYPIAKPDIVEVVAENSITGPRETPDAPKTITLDKQSTEQILSVKKLAEDVDREARLLELQIKLAQRDLKDTLDKKRETVSIYQSAIKSALTKNGVSEALLDQYFGEVKDGVLVFNYVEPKVTEKAQKSDK